MNSRSLIAVAALLQVASLALALTACGRRQNAAAISGAVAADGASAGTPAAQGRGSIATMPGTAEAAPYPVSERGGTPATGPGARYNYCERIWCFVHHENFFIDHFLSGHNGWILHDDLRGDIFVTRPREGGPAFPDAKLTLLRLCGRHAHPWYLGRRGGPIHHTGYNHTLGYDRGHFRAFGTRLDPCCVNGLGFAFVHSNTGRLFQFDNVDEYRAHPESGWQQPFRALRGAGASEKP